MTSASGSRFWIAFVAAVALLALAPLGLPEYPLNWLRYRT
jgi:hypothetical protein